MVRRTLAAQAPGARVVRIPRWLLGLAAGPARRLGAPDWGPGALARLARDQVADAAPAREAFGYAPRKFVP
jgi:hypothetical protein